jgi:RNA polymerase sigma-70 factor (ECF subfamily)
MTSELAALLMRERRRAVALLARQLGLGHLALAEDAVQTATLRALERWPREGVPERPAAWLYRVAQRLAIDELRHTRPHAELPDDAAPEALAAPPASESRLAGELNDDELALVFAACHPALPPATQVALALRSLLGLELAAIAPLLFSTEAALAQRLARSRVTLAGHALAVPGGAELPPRREAVLSTLALVFHHGQVAAGRQGHSPQGDDPLALCWEAIRLARALAAHPATASPQADALAALLLLHGARLTGRIDDAGELVPLHGQPRDRWDAGLIRLGLGHLQASQRGTALTRWHLQAGIAAEHAMASTPEATNWPAIVRYYALLLAQDPSPAPRLGHAIALAEAGEPAEAERALRALLPTVPQALQAHACAALARSLVRQGRGEEAEGWWQRAIEAAVHPAEARMLARARLGVLDGS